MGSKSRSSIDRAKSRLGRLHGAVSDPSSDGVISWSESGKSFIVWKPEELLTDVLPKWGIALSSFPSFTDGFLKGYGFRKVNDSGSEERWEFEEEDFVRGQPERIGAMYRRTKEREDNSERGKERMKKVEERMRARREKARMMKEENNQADQGTSASA